MSAGDSDMQRVLGIGGYFMWAADPILKAIGLSCGSPPVRVFVPPVTCPESQMNETHLS